MKRIFKQVSLVFATLALVLITHTASAQTSPTISWGGFQWAARSGQGGPGPNTWSPNNVFVDASGNMHFQINNSSGTWSSAELDMTNPATMGFGTYQFQMLSEADTLDPNTVFGFFLYPPASVGPGGTNEIDVEWSRWGNINAFNGNFTVWPAVTGITRSWTGFFLDSAVQSTHRFIWTPQTVTFQSMDGLRNVGDTTGMYANWTFDPANPPNPTQTNNLQYFCPAGDTAQQCIAQQQQLFIINLWQFSGQTPTSGQTQEVVLKNFTYVPLGGPTPTPTPTPTPCSGCPTPTPTPKPTATPTPNNSCYPAWVSNVTYQTGTRVTYNGVNYQANYPTNGDNPALHSGPAGSGQPWLTLGACSGSPSPTPTPTATPKPTATPTVTPKPTATPTATPKPTATPTPSNSCYPAWVNNITYPTGAHVSYGGKNYQANYPTNGDNPGVHSGPAGSGQPWLTLGACTASLLPLEMEQSPNVLAMVKTEDRFDAVPYQRYESRFTQG